MWFFWCNYWYKNSIFYSFSYYWAGSLLTTARYHELLENPVYHSNSNVFSGMGNRYWGKISRLSIAWLFQLAKALSFLKRLYLLSKKYKIICFMQNLLWYFSIVKSFLNTYKPKDLMKMFAIHISDNNRETDSNVVSISVQQRFFPCSLF